MRIRFKGEDLGEFNGSPTLAEARLIKQELGMLPMDFGVALTKADPDAMSMLVAIMLTRAGRPVSWDQVDGEFDDFDTVLTDEEQKQVDAAEAAAADPLGKAGKNGLYVVGRPGSSAPDPEPQTLTWTGSSPATPPDSGDTSDSPS